MRGWGLEITETCVPEWLQKLFESWESDLHHLGVYVQVVVDSLHQLEVNVLRLEGSGTDRPFANETMKLDDGFGVNPV